MDIQHQHGYQHHWYVRIPEYTGKRSHICKTPWRIAFAEHKIHTSAAMSSKAKMIVRSAPDTISFTGSIAIARKANG